MSKKMLGDAQKQHEVQRIASAYLVNGRKFAML